MNIIIKIAFLIITIVIGNVLYYFCGLFKKVGSTSMEEVNDSELFVSREGELEEVFPDELVDEEAAKGINLSGRVFFRVSASLLWMIMGLTAGRIAVLLRPSDLFKIVIYCLIYFVFLRTPFGITNRTIERTYEVKVMPEKLAIAVIMILGYMIGINAYAYIPEILVSHLRFVG